MNAELKYIGVVHSPLRSLEDCPRQELENAPPATIELFEAYQQGLEDIKPGDAIILFTWLHAADRSILKTHPRNDTSIPLTGIFSTRSPDRPNPIGIHSVTITSVLSASRFVVSGLEVLDQTPVIDIKPDLKM